MISFYNSTLQRKLSTPSGSMTNLQRNGQMPSHNLDKLQSPLKQKKGLFTMVKRKFSIKVAYQISWRSFMTTQILVAILAEIRQPQSLNFPLFPVHPPREHKTWDNTPPPRNGHNGWFWSGRLGVRSKIPPTKSDIIRNGVIYLIQLATTLAPLGEDHQMPF